MEQDTNGSQEGYMDIERTEKGYDGSKLTFQLLRACGWSNFINLGFFRWWDWLFSPVRLERAQERLAKKSVELLGVKIGHDVLDLACGRGASSFIIAMGNPRASVTGVDLLAQQIAAAQLLYKNTNNLKYLEGKAEDLPFKSQSFDRVHCLEAAFHFDRLRFLKEAYRILRPGGVLVVVDFMWKSESDRQVRWTPEGELVRAIWEFDDFWSLDEYLAGGRNVGFKLVKALNWSGAVTAGIQRRFMLLSRFCQFRLSRLVCCWLNQRLKYFNEEDWKVLLQQAKAHDRMRRASKYVALILAK